MDRQVLQTYLETIPQRQNMYITTKDYRQNLHPTYYMDKVLHGNTWQLATYYVAAEIARRYGARYIVDLGCGNGGNVAKLRNQFNIVAIDYGDNFKNASKNFPFMTFVEANLDTGGDCNVVLDPEVLSQAVVLSADVIEHIVDPFHCYIKLLKMFSQDALALVVSTPARDGMFRVYHRNSSLRGPPFNAAHVREWLDRELELMFLDAGMFPLYSGQACGHLGGCSKGFTVQNSSLSNQIHITGNTKVRSKWLEISSGGPSVIAFVVLRKSTNKILLEYNIKHLYNQGIKVYIITVGSIPLGKSSKFTSVKVDSEDDILVSTQIPGLQLGDWLIIMDANEIITFPQSAALNLTLKDTLLHIGEEPYGFNGVALSTFFMQDKNGSTHPDEYPFKVFALSAWNVGYGKNDDMWPAVDTFKYRVKIWRHGENTINFSKLKTEANTYSIVDINYVGRHVYPFHAQSLRFHPEWTYPYAYLDEDLRRMYILESAVG